MSSEKQDSLCCDEGEQDAPEAVVPGVVPSSNESDDKEITDAKNARFVCASFGVACDSRASVDVRCAVCSRDNVLFSSFSEDVYIVSVSRNAVLEIHHGNVRVTRQQLAGQEVFTGNVLARGTVDSVPCVVAATWGKGSGLYIHHAFTGQLIRSLPFREDVWCVCIDRSGTLVVFGTKSGVWVRLTRMTHCYGVV